MATIVQELRRLRRTRRLGELEWFEVAYRAYLVAFIGGGAVLWASSLVEDLELTPDEVADVRRLGPRVLGLFVAGAVALGLRSGSDGGPIALEAGDVQYLLLAPVPRRAVMTRPVVQRLRAVAFGGAVIGGIAGLLAADRLPGSPTAWTASGAVFGALTGAAFVAVAVVTHALRVPRAAATAIAAALLAAQIAAVAGWLPAGPADTLGSLALWGMRQHAVDLVGAAVIVALALVAVGLADRLRTEPLVRRAGLVAQLRFAVTMQDLRTVMLLRRQLRGEHARATPWLTLSRASAGGATASIWRRGWRGLLRSPAPRLVRMAGLAALGGIAAAAVAAGTVPLIVGVAAALYLLGLDAIEPLSQEIYHPDHTDAAPRPRGWILVRHLLVPALIVVPFALIGAAVVTIAEPAHAAAAFGLAIPVAWGGVAGAVVSVVRDAPDPLAAPASTAVPPEFAGFTTTFRLLWPLVISVVGVLPIAFLVDVSGADATGSDPTVTAGDVVRAAVASLLLVTVVGWWVRRRDEWRRAWRKVLEEGRAAKRAASTGGTA